MDSSFSVRDTHLGAESWCQKPHASAGGRQPVEHRGWRLAPRGGAEIPQLFFREPLDGEPDNNPRLMIVVRYVVPGAIVLAGVLALVFNHSITGLEGLAMGIGVGASVLLLNVLYRVGVKGDAERDLEEDARDYLDEHGHWPDEEPAQRRR